MKQDRETIVAKQVPKITINDNTVIPYPEHELCDLEACLKYNGFLKQCIDHTGVAANTIKSYPLVKQGEFKKVNLVRGFVKGFLKAAAQAVA